MAKAATGTKKTKDAISKAATQKKGGHKKWTKGKAKEKADNAVFVTQAQFDRMMVGIPKLGKHISVTHVVEKFKVVGSLARAVLKRLQAKGDLKQAEQHSRQGLYYPTVAIVEKVA